MSSRTQARGEVVSAPPVFFLHEETPDNVTHVDICQAAERVVGFGSIVGAQRLGGLWRLYPLSMEVRATLLTARLLLMGKSIALSSQNPFSLRDKDGREIPSTRLTVDGLPVSVSSADLEGYLRKAGASMRSPLLWEKARDRDGKLTRWVTGRRFVWIDLPVSPLPHQLLIGSFVAKLYYREQPRPAPVCYQCGKEGHRRGDPECQGSAAEHVQRSSGNQSAGEVSDRGESGESSGEESDLVTDTVAGSEVDREGEGLNGQHGGDEREDEDIGDDRDLNPQEESVMDDGVGGGKKDDSEEEVYVKQRVALDRGEGGTNSGIRTEDVEKTKGKGKGKGKKSSKRESLDSGKEENQKGNDRGRQTSLSDHFLRAERTPSLKRQEPPSPSDEGHKTRRPRH